MGILGKGEKKTTMIMIRVKAPLGLLDPAELIIMNCTVSFCPENVTYQVPRKLSGGTGTPIYLCMDCASMAKLKVTTEAVQPTELKVLSGL